jgi:hypothetical protein
MAKLKGGILGSAHGKVSGVVASSWKGINYVRTLVTPANPKTAQQVAARDKFATCAQWGMCIIGQILNPYVGPFQRRMSGFNWFVKTNLAVFVTPMVYSLVKVCHGNLKGVDAPSISNAGGTITVQYGSSLGPSGLATDLVMAFCYDEVSGLFYYAAAEVARSVGTLTIPGVPIATGDKLDCWVITCRRDRALAAGKVLMVSDSQYCTMTM